MGCGKSFFCGDLIKNIDNLVYDYKRYEETKVILVSNCSESIERLEKICNQKNFKFFHWSILPDLDNLLDTSEDRKHSIMILEDFSYKISQKTSSEYMGVFKNFLVNSRHKNISIIYILHNFDNAMTHRNSIDRFYMKNATFFTVFKPIDKKSVYTYLKQFFITDKNFYRTLDMMFSKIGQISQYPYIFIQPRSKLKDNFAKIRCRLFEENLIFIEGFNPV